MKALSALSPFEGQNITVTMLQHLHRIGPGGLIVAKGAMAPYEVVHSRELDLGFVGLVFIYGHSDLTRDLSRYASQWHEVARSITETARTHYHGWFFSMPSPLVRALREDAQRRGMNLNARPELSWTEDSALRTDDHFAWSGDNRITFNMTYERRHRDSLLICLSMYNDGRYVACWSERVTVSSGTPNCIREAPGRALRHLCLYQD